MKTNPRIAACLTCFSLAAALALSGCGQVRDFLIPPEDSSRVEARQRARNQASLVISGVQLGDQGAPDNAIAIRGDRIVAVGKLESLGPHIGAYTATERLNGGQAWPGLSDAHVDLVAAALFREAIDLSHLGSPTDLGELLKSRGQELPSGQWLWGHGLAAPLLGRIDADVLEVLAPGVPVWISRGPDHGAVISRALLTRLPQALRDWALQRRGLVAGEGGRRVWRALELPATGRLKPLLVQTFSDLRAQGVTTVQTLDADARLWEVLLELERDQRLDMRCLLYLDASAEFTRQELLRRVAALQPKRLGKPGQRAAIWQASLARIVGVSAHLDGPASAHDAALSAPYTDRPSDRGALLHDDDNLMRLLLRVDAARLQLALFVHGDAAVAQALRVLSAARRPAGALPVRLEGARGWTPAQRAALARLSVVLSRQPVRTSRERTLLGARLGPERAALLDGHADLPETCTLLAGSNLPWEDGDPWRRWEALVRPQGAGAVGLSAGRALSSMTADGVGRAATLSPGAHADLVIWAHAPFARPTAPRLRLLVVGGVIIAHNRREGLTPTDIHLPTVAPLPQASTPQGAPSGEPAAADPP